MKTENKFNRLRLSYKIAVVSAVSMIICIILTLTSLLSIYSLVGETSIEDTAQTTSAIKELDDKEKRNNILNGIILLSTFTLLLSAGYGVYQDVKAKSKK